MYVTPILLLLLASNAFADGAKDWQERFSNVGINTKETSCVVKDLKMNLDTLLSMANEQQNENAPELILLTDNCQNYYASSIKTSFDSALIYCRIEKMQLATPDTPAKLQCLRESLLKYGMPDDYWIAASNVGRAFFIWRTTNQYAIFNTGDWENGHPSGVSDRCVIINSTTRLLRDILCPGYKHFICEKY